MRTTIMALLLAGLFALTSPVGFGDESDGKRAGKDGADTPEALVERVRTALSAGDHRDQALCFAPEDRPVRALDVLSLLGRAGAQLQQPLSRSLSGVAGEEIAAVAVSPDGTCVVSGDGNGKLTVWDVNTGERVRALSGHREAVVAVAVSPDASWLVSGSWDKTLKIWDAATGKLLRTLTGHEHPVLAVAISPDGKHVFSGALDHTVRVWNVETGEAVRTITGHTRPVSAVAADPGGRWIVSASGDRTLRVWDASTGELVRVLKGHKAPVTAVAADPRGRWIVSGSEDDTLKLWDATNGAELRTLAGHTGYVQAVAVSLDGKSIVSGSADETLRIWDAETGALRRSLSGHDGWVIAVALGPNGKRILSGSKDHTLVAWDTATGEPARTLAGAEERALRARLAAVVADEDRIRKKHGFDKLVEAVQGGAFAMAHAERRGAGPLAMKRALAKQYLSGVDLGAVLEDMHEFVAKHAESKTPDDRSSSLFEAGVTDVVVDGDRATGKLGSETLSFVRVGGRWYLSVEPPSRGRRRR